MDQVEFLRARIQEDERDALDRMESVLAMVHPLSASTPPRSGPLSPYVKMAPLRVAADCALKLRLLDEIERLSDPAAVLWQMTIVYAEHPDLKPEWLELD